MKHFILLLLFHYTFGDICGDHATLIEKDRFHLSQPFNTEVEIDLKNYFEFFTDLDQSLPLFKNALENYTTLNKLEKLEPLPFVPFDKERNVFLLKDLYPDTKQALQACANEGGELISFHNQQTRAQLVEAIKSLNLTFAPLKVLPLFNAIFDPKFRYLDTPDSSHFKALSEGLPPVLHKNGTLIYPSLPEPPPKPAAPAEGSGSEPPGSGRKKRETASETTTRPPVQAGRTLCFKPNNPWDRVENRAPWIEKTKHVRNSISFLEQCALAFQKVRRVLQGLDLRKASSIRKLQLPVLPSMKSIISFLKEFSSPLRWELSVPQDEELFDKFIQNSHRVEKLLNGDHSNLLQWKKAGQKWNFPLTPSSSWTDTVNLDSSTGIIQPVYIKPLGLSSEHSSRTNDFSIVAEVEFSAFRHDEITYLYAIEPNFVKNNMVNASFVVAFVTNPIATMEAPLLKDCSKSMDGIKACRSLTIPRAPVTHEQKMIDCAKALMRTDLGANIDKCPMVPAPSHPSAYRAHCNDSDPHQTAIVNSNSPLKLSITCGGQDKAVKEFKQFPVRLDTECEIQEHDGDLRRIILPQIHKDFLQTQSLGQIVTPSPMTTTPPSTKIEVFLLPLGLMGATAFVILLMILSIIAIIDPSKFSCKSCCKKQRGQPEMLELSQISARDPRSPRVLESSRVSRAPSRRSLNEGAFQQSFIKLNFPPKSSTLQRY